MRVLIVDDDASIRDIVRRAIELLPTSTDVDVVEAGDASAALAITGSIRVDVAVLDVHLPDIGGLELIPRIHAHDAEIRVLVLSAAITERDRVAGLAAGADDYMVKPFSVVELGARVLALGRRRMASAPPVVDFGDTRVDMGSRAVTHRGTPIDLTRREFDLLAFLATHPRTTFTRDELLRGAFTSSAEWQSGATITEHVRRLRQKIESDPACPAHLMTVRGMGYRFEPGDTSVELLPSSAPSSTDAGIVHVDGQIVYVSPLALALLGHDDVSAVVGRHPFDFVSPASMAHATARRELRANGTWPRPEILSVTRADGREVVVQVSSTRVLWEGQPAIQVTMWELESESP